MAIQRLPVSEEEKRQIEAGAQAAIEAHVAFARSEAEAYLLRSGDSKVVSHMSHQIKGNNRSLAGAVTSRA